MSKLDCAKSIKSITPSETARKLAEDECKEVCIRYSLPTKVGNWCEEQTLLEEKINRLEMRMDRCETFLQKKNAVLEHLYEPMKISRYTQYLLYNMPIQIYTDLQYSLDLQEKPTKFVLSTLITEKQIGNDNILQVQAGCAVTLSKNHIRMRRNVFTFMNCESDKTGHAISFNDDVFIRLYDSGSQRQLYLRCEIPHLDSFGLAKNHYPVTLSETPDRYCKFKLTDWNTHLQVFTEGTPIRSNARVCILHTCSNRLLAIECNTFIVSLIGKERTSACFTYKNIHKQITSENYWIVVTQGIGEDIGEDIEM